MFPGLEQLKINFIYTNNLSLASKTFIEINWGFATNAMSAFEE